MVPITAITQFSGLIQPSIQRVLCFYGCRENSHDTIQAVNANLTPLFFAIDLARGCRTCQFSLLQLRLGSVSFRWSVRSRYSRKVAALPRLHAAKPSRIPRNDTTQSSPASISSPLPGALPGARCTCSESRLASHDPRPESPASRQPQCRRHLPPLHSSPPPANPGTCQPKKLC